jgi:hypothetical protein
MGAKSHVKIAYPNDNFELGNRQATLMLPILHYVRINQQAPKKRSSWKANNNELLALLPSFLNAVCMLIPH